MENFLKQSLTCSTELMGSMSSRLEKQSGNIERRAEAILEEINNESLDTSSMDSHIHWMKRYRDRVAKILDEMDSTIEHFEKVNELL